MLDKSIGIILCTVFLSNTIYGLAAPFLPALLAEKGIASTWTGVIFAAYAVSMVFVSLAVGKVLDRIGHAKIMAFGALLMALSIASFSSAIYIESNAAIIAVAVLLRACQGK